MKHIILVGCGFAGLKAARIFGTAPETVRVTIIDKSNHHLFQPLLYQVATAGLGPSDIAVPIRNILSSYKNISVLKDTVISVDKENQTVTTESDTLSYDYLVLACGVQHSYFGNSQWERFAPGLKTLEQADEIRRRILSAFESAEKEKDVQKRKKLLTFAVIGGGPTGVELAGALGEMTRYTLAGDFRNIDPKLTRIMLIEGGGRILSSFSERQSSRATRDLEKLGVQVWTSSTVTHIDETGVMVSDEKIEASTVLWAAGVKAPSMNDSLDVEVDNQGRIIVSEDLSVPGEKNIFVAGDQASFNHQTGTPLPCLSPVAIQQGQCIGENILRDLSHDKRKSFKYKDKGTMATIGRSKAIADFGFLRFDGFIAWVLWLTIHIYFITGFNNRFIVFIKWCAAYFTNRHGARIILENKWNFFDESPDKTNIL